MARSLWRLDRRIDRIAFDALRKVISFEAVLGAKTSILLALRLSSSAVWLCRHSHNSFRRAVIGKRLKHGVFLRQRGWDADAELRTVVDAD
jgi:hypothetical protein